MFLWDRGGKRAICNCETSSTLAVSKSQFRFEIPSISCGDWNSIFRWFRFSGTLGKPREVYPKLQIRLPEFLDVSVEWFTFHKFHSFQIFQKLSSKEISVLFRSRSKISAMLGQMESMHPRSHNCFPLYAH